MNDEEEHEYKILDEAFESNYDEENLSIFDEYE